MLERYEEQIVELDLPRALTKSLLAPQTVEVNNI